MLTSPEVLGTGIAMIVASGLMLLSCKTTGTCAVRHTWQRFTNPVAVALLGATTIMVGTAYFYGVGKWCEVADHPSVHVVAPGSIAEEAGIRRVSLLQTIDGMKFQDWQQVNRVFANVKRGGTVTLGLWYPQLGNYEVTLARSLDDRNLTFDPGISGMPLGHSASPFDAMAEALRIAFGMGHSYLSSIVPGMTFVATDGWVNLSAYHGQVFVFAYWVFVRVLFWQIIAILATAVFSSVFGPVRQWLSAALDAPRPAAVRVREE